MEGEKEKNNSSQQKDMPISRNSSSYAAGGNSHNNIFTSSSAASQLLYNIGPTQYSSLQLEDQRPCKKVVVRYKECLKNHVAAIGGNATDGCGEFMPSGEQGSLEALKCSACNCHRNFHRKEIEGESSSSFDLFHSPPGSRFILGHHHNGILGSPQGLYPITAMLSSRPPPNHQMIVSYNNTSGSVPSESDEQDLYDDDDDGNGDGAVVAVARQVDHQKPKKRFRTKFTEEQKQKMLNFAEKAGWKMQKLEDSLVQRFCQEIGIKRRVLKVWMHNNKHHFSKKPSSAS